MRDRLGGERHYPRLRYCRAADAEAESFRERVECVVVRLESGLLELSEQRDRGGQFGGRLGSEENLRRPTRLSVDRENLVEELAAERCSECLGVGFADVVPHLSLEIRSSSAELSRGRRRRGKGLPDDELGNLLVADGDEPLVAVGRVAVRGLHDLDLGFVRDHDRAEPHGQTKGPL